MTWRAATLPGASRLADVTLLVMRWATAAFLIVQCHDNLLSSDRMKEFEGFMAHFGFWRPDILAPLTITLQVAAAVSFIVGFLVRPFGLIIAGMFVVGIAMVHLADPPNIVWSAASLVVIGLYLGTNGGGRYALDTLLAKDRGRLRS